MIIESRNPATGGIIRQYNALTGSEIELKLAKAELAFRSWRSIKFEDRAKIVAHAGDLLRQRSRSYGTIITGEMGKVIRESVAEVEKCALCCEFYASNADRILSVRTVSTDAKRSGVRYDPIGLVLAIMPWNFPFWQVFRFAAPALIAGNTVLLKHASNVSGSALAIESLFAEAGAPAGVFTTLLIGSGAVESVIRDSRVRAVTFTGSGEAGARVASVAGSVLKKIVLELGGSDPFVVLEDADLVKAAKVGATSRFMNCGQSCIAAKRFIVQKKVEDEFLNLFRMEIEKIAIGDPMNDTTQMGPMARPDLRGVLQRQVERSVQKGAEIVFGGEIPEGAGVFYPVTLMTGIKPEMPAAKEELFGPVAPVMLVEDDYEAVEMANSSIFGLGASVWTKDMDRVQRLVSSIDSGSVFINGMTKSDPRLPFGGIKGSGYGRELSDEGIKEFCNIKTFWMAG